MNNLRKTFLTAAMVLGLFASAFGQKGNDNSNKRPQKDPPQVVVKEKDKPPPSNHDKKPEKKP